jgi:hypothetical protein
MALPSSSNPPPSAERGAEIVALGLFGMLPLRVHLTFETT